MNRLRKEATKQRANAKELKVEKTKKALKEIKDTTKSIEDISENASNNDK